MKTGMGLFMFKKKLSPGLLRRSRQLLTVTVLLGFGGSLGLANAASPTLQEAKAQVSVWQGELAKATRAGDAAGVAAARGQIGDWQAILTQLEAEAKREALLREARENASKADEIAKLRNIQVPANLQGEQRAMYILRQDQILQEKEKTAQEKAAQEQQKAQLSQAIASGDYQLAKGYVDRGAKGDIELVQLAVDRGFTGIAYLLINSNPQLQYVDIQRVLGTALIKAVGTGSAERVNNLLKLGADVNYTAGDLTPMLMATRGGNIEMVNILVAQGARRDPMELGKLLFRAVQQNNQNQVDALIRLGANPNVAEQGATALSTALDAGNLGLATALINGGAAADPAILGRALYRAVEGGDEGKVAALLKMGANVNFVVGGQTALTAALNRQNMGMATLLIRAGGDEPTGQFGRRLFDAALEGDMSWIRVLAQLPKYRDYRNAQGETPLHAAASRGNDEAVTTLLGAGADPNVLTVKNWSPLHHAARFGHKLALIQLLKGGSDVYALNSDGNDAYQLAAIAMKNPKIALDNQGVLEYIRTWQQYHPRR